MNLLPNITISRRGIVRKMASLIIDKTEILRPAPDYSGAERGSVLPRDHADGNSMGGR